jgi:hypothetical protein
MCHLGDHEESVLSNRTHPGESQGGIVISIQATTALCTRGSRIIPCTSVCQAQGGRMSYPGSKEHRTEASTRVPRMFNHTHSNNMINR